MSDISDALIWLIAVPNTLGIHALCSDLKIEFEIEFEIDLRAYFEMLKKRNVGAQKRPGRITEAMGVKLVVEGLSRMRYSVT